MGSEGKERAGVEGSDEQAIPTLSSAAAPPSAREVAAMEDTSAGLRQHRLTLQFRSRAAEGEYVAEQASSRWRVLALVGSFDCAMIVLRAAVKLVTGHSVGRGLLAQLGNMGLLYSLTALLNARTRRMGSRAARQEETLLCCLVSGAICLLLLSLRPGNAGDYVYAALFLTCASAVLKLRWYVGTLTLAAPVLLAVTANLRLRWAGTAAAASAAAAACMAAVGGGAAAAPGACDALAPRPAASLGPLQLECVGLLPLEAVLHILVAWAVGALMAFVADTNRRESFVHHKLALHAAGKELEEVQARVLMERELAAAQRQSVARALVVAQEKAANEAKSEFMSLMCHEVRTPLNGCLASAEMLLDTQLDEEQRELAKTIRVSGSILLSTVSNFLDFFKIEAGKQLDIVRSALDLRDLVTDVHCIIEAMVGRERGVTLQPPDLEGAPATVLGDPSRICGILLNLYTNAAKYTKKGSIGLRVRVVGPSYRPHPAEALAFCEANGGAAPEGGSGSGSGGASRTSRSLSASMPDSAPNASRCSTPTDVLAAPAGVRAAPAVAQPGSGSGKPGAAAFPGHAPAGSGSGAGPHPLYQHGGPAEHDSAHSLATAGASSASAAADAAALLNRQAAAASAGVPHAIMSSVTEVDGWSSVHSQPDPRFVLRHTSGSAASGPSTGTGSEEGDEEGGASPRFLCFEVMDTGVGVSHKALESLFQDYVQGTDSEMRRPRSKGGTGLGLSICCKQVAVLGGAIGALSKPACGSLFWFTVPLILPAHDSSSADSLEESEEEAAAAAHAAPAEGPAAALTPAQAAGKAAIRRSLEAVQAGAGSAAGAEEAAAAAAERDVVSQLPAGIPSSPHRLHAPPAARQPSAESGSVARGGSRRQSMESDLSSMWTSHHVHKPHRVRSGGSLASMGEEEGGGYYPRHALSWEQAPQPPSFTAAEMLAQMPVQQQTGQAAGVPNPTALQRRSVGRAAAGGRGVGHLAASARHTAPAGATPANSAVAGSPPQQQHPAGLRSLQGLRVLLAEDNLINQTVAKRVLTSLGCECRVASNGREAVLAVSEASARGAQFDVILMDMCMPVLGGVEATQEIRQLGCTVPIVAMTANASERDRVECIAAGMDGFLSKPVLKEQLTVAIREATQRGHS